MPFLIKNLRYHKIHPIDLLINDGECIGLSGPSGSGKSLFLRALADLDPHDGDVRLDDMWRHDCKPHEWRKKVGLLPAESQWWFDTVGSHFVKYDRDYLDRLGFETAVMGWETSRLSSGEKQRLALLRLLANQPKVLLLDEPTANLDRTYAGQVESILADYRASNNAALLWVSHDQDQLSRVADRLFEIKDKQIVEVTHG